MGLLILDRTVVKAFSRRKPALPVIVLLAIALVGLLAPGAIGQAQEAEGSPPSDYDGDDDGLIEVRNLSQLHAVRWDLNGDGVADHADYISTYTAAFPVADGGSVCPGGTTCTGYELTAELDFDEDGDGQITAADSTYWNGGAGWHPIGPLGVTPGLYGTIENPGSDQPSLFDATFEGNGYTIANLFVKRARSKSVGLFSVLGRGADVKNLELSGVDVEGYYYVGGLGGYSEPNTSITNVQVTGQVVGYYDVGGLIGEIFGSLTRSSADVAVTGNTHVGGLVGENEYSGTISDSFSTGTVTGTYKDAGGLVGYNEGGLTDKKGTIIRSYATGSVTGKTNVGGLVGKNLGYIRASYSMGAVSGVKAVGGLVGFSENGQRVKTSYATGSVSGTSEVGGSVGRTTRGALSGVYYDSDISGAAGAGGKTTAELTTPTGYSSVFASWNLDLDNADSDNDDSTGGDDPWDFGTALQFPALKADFDGDRTATWQEFGEQIREKGSVVLNSTPKQTEKKEPESKVDVDLGQVETGQQIRYPPPLSKLSGAQGCLIGAGVLYKTVEGKEVVTRSDNGFSLDYSDGLPRLAGRAKFLAAPTTYRIEYICGFPHSWSGSYTLKVEVIGAGMGFGADNLGHVRLYRDQDRTINPPELFFAEGDVSYAISPSLPAGLSIDTSTGVISGAPSAIQDQITYTITATDSKSGGAQTATFDVRLSVKVGMHWPVSNMPDQVFEAGDRIEIVPPALVNPTGKLRYRYRSSHPGLLFLHPYSGTLLASSATPMVKNTYTITAYEDCRCNDRTPQRVNITVNVEVQDVHYLGAGQTVNIPAMALPNLSGNISYALAGTPALPTGLSFNTGTGQISGTLDPNATQPKQTYTITATDANSKTVEYRFKIEVRKLVMSGTEAGYEVGAGYPLSISPTTSGAIGTVSYSISPAASQLPDGVGFNTTTGEISGTPALEFAQKSFTVTATDSGSPPQTADYTVAINVTPSALVPRLTISGGSSVTEGDTAVFTVTATPAPSVWLWVDVTVSQAGDFGVSTGARTVTVPTSGSVTVSVSTADDSADELNGSVSVAVNPGSGYSVSGSQGSAHVAVADNDHHPPLVTSEVSVTGGSGITEGGDASFTVSASPAPSSPLSVSVTVSQVGDFGASTGSRTVTVPTGGTVTLTIATTDDGVDEPNGSVGVAVNSGSGYTVSSSQGSATVNVSDNDVPPASVDGCVEALSGSGSVQGSYGSECGSQARSGRYARFFTFSLSSQAAVRIDLESSLDTYLFLRRGLDQRSSGIVTADDDGGPGLNSRISRTLGAGVYTIEATTYGARRSGLFTLSVSGIPGQVQTLPVVSVTAGSGITEGGDASFTVSASPAPSSPLSVSVTVSQSGDFGATTGSQTVTVPTSGSATVTVGTTDDTTDETDGSVSVAVNSGSGYTVSGSQGSASVSVADNDVPPPSTPEVSVTAGSGITEGGNASFTVSASPAPSSPLSVSVTVSQSGDFGASTGSRTVIVPTSGTATLTVGTTDDNTDETDGSVSVAVNSGSGYTVSGSQGSASVSVADNDVPPPSTPEISIVAGSGITEGGNASFTVAASPAPTSPLSVSVTVTQSGDFGASTGSRTVIVPTSGTATLAVSTTDDSTDEVDGSVTVTVDALSGYTVSATQGSASVSVADNDVPPPSTPEISITAGSGITEGGNASFTVAASPAPTSPLSVSVTVSQSGDFGASTGTRTVTVPISGTATVTVGTTDDNTDEVDGSVTVTVNARSGYTVSSTQGSASVNVADNDDPPPTDLPEVSISDDTVVEGEPPYFLEFTVTLSQRSEQNVTVTYETREVTATDHLDYQGTRNGRVVIWSGRLRATLIVHIRDDVRREAHEETFNVVLTAADGATITNSTATGTIIDDE